MGHLLYDEILQYRGASTGRGKSSPPDRKGLRCRNSSADEPNGGRGGLREIRPRFRRNLRTREMRERECAGRSRFIGCSLRRFLGGLEAGPPTSEGFPWGQCAGA